MRFWIYHVQQREIGVCMGGREPSTIRHAIRRAEEWIDDEPKYREAWNELLAEIGETDPGPRNPVGKREYRTPTKPRADRDMKPCARNCLCCGHRFQSEGVHERVCRRCKASELWRASQGADPSVMPR